MKTKTIWYSEVQLFTWVQKSFIQYLIHIDIKYIDRKITSMQLIRRMSSSQSSNYVEENK